MHLPIHGRGTFWPWATGIALSHGAAISPFDA